MAGTMERLPGHAYAPGFEPSSWDALVSFLNNMNIPAEGIALFVAAICVAWVMASRISTRQSKRRRRTPLFPDLDFTIKTGGPSLKPQGPRRKGSKAKQLDERAKHFWDA